MISGETLLMWLAGWRAQECWIKYRSEDLSRTFFKRGHIYECAVCTHSIVLYLIGDLLLSCFFFFQVTEETSQMVESVGYSVTLRGVVNVKGKGDLTTYFVNTEHSSPPF